MADYATLLRDHVTFQYRSIDRIFLLLAKAWRDWRTALIVVQPNTIVPLAPPMAPAPLAQR